MALVIFRKYLEIGEALIAFSALESAGFHPSWHNYHHAHIAYMKMIAFGGLIIMMPETEIGPARAWLRDVRQAPQIEGDDIPERKYGMWRNTFTIAAFSGPAALFIPFVWVKWWKYGLGLLLFTGLLALGFGLQSPGFRMMAFWLVLATISAFGIVLALLPPLLLLGLWGIGLIALIVLYGLSPEFIAYSYLLIPIGILLHAKYRAMPRAQSAKQETSI